MPRHPPRSSNLPARPADAQGAGHEPAPVDLGCESVAGEEDPGASAEPPTATRADEAESRPPARPTGPSRS